MHIDDSYKSCRFSPKTKLTKYYCFECYSSCQSLLKCLYLYSHDGKHKWDAYEPFFFSCHCSLSTTFRVCSQNTSVSLSRYPVCPVVNNACPWHVFGRVPKVNDRVRHWFIYRFYSHFARGSVAEWSKALVLGTSLNEAWVRIPPLPLNFFYNFYPTASIWH